MPAEVINWVHVLAWHDKAINGITFTDWNGQAIEDDDDKKLYNPDNNLDNNDNDDDDDAITVVYTDENKNKNNNENEPGLGLQNN